MSRCRSCGASIVWAVTDTGKRMPVDADPHPEGNCALTTEDDGTVHVHAFAIPVAGSLLYPEAHLSHFATCPQRDEWRQR